MERDGRSLIGHELRGNVDSERANLGGDDGKETNWRGIPAAAGVFPAIQDLVRAFE